MQALRAREGQAEARHHFIEDEHRTVLRTEFTETSQETSVRQDQTHVGRERLDDETGNLADVGLEERAERGKIIIFRDQSVGGGTGRDTGGIRITLRECARARLYEE